MFIKGLRGTVLFALLLTLLLCLTAAPAVSAAERVVILPFEANAPQDISYLVKGVRDMLATRLAWHGKVTVIEHDLVAPVMQKIPGPYNEAKARQIGQELGAGSVVFGSISMFGKAVSLDARLVRSGDDSPPLATFIQAPNLDEVIPQINQFAQKINAEIYNRPEALAALKQQTQEQPKQGTRDRSDLIGKVDSPAKQFQQEEETDLEQLPPNTSPLNPLFLKQLSGVESDRYWRSPTIQGTIESVAVADIDLDGKNELLALLNDRIRVYRLTKDQFTFVQEIKNGPGGEYLFVDAGDINGDGRPEIFVTCLHNLSLNSFVMEWKQGGLQITARGLPFFLRVQNKMGQKGKKMLLGQKKNVAEAYAGPVYELKAVGEGYEIDRELTLPEQATIFGSVIADLNGSGTPYTVYVGPRFDLRVASTKEDSIWNSNEVFAASAKIIDQPNRWTLRESFRESYGEVFTFLPTRIIAVDLDGDNREEIIVIRNKDRANFSLERLKAFYQGNIMSLSWNGLNLVETWRTPRVSGYLTDLAIADVGNVGRPALIMSVTKRAMSGFLPKDKSYLVAFTLKPTKSAKEFKNKGL
jgi:TolB-like protein